MVMTYAIEEDSMHAQVRKAVKVVGKDRMAETCDVSISRLDQLSNPMRRDLKTSELIMSMDIACAKAGGGTPLFDYYAQRLDAAGVLSPAGARYFGLCGVVRKVVEILRSAADALDEAVSLPSGQLGYARTAHA